MRDNDEGAALNIGTLNGLFAIPGHLHFEAGEGGLAKVAVNNAYAHCEIYLHGAHITSFGPHDEDEVLWLSKSAQYSDAKAIRGGIPICWPWFGPDPENKGRAQHGFARNSLWTVFGTSVNAKGETLLRLGLQDSEASRKLWPYVFMTEYHITVGKTLHLELKTINEDEKPFALSSALHTYFAVDHTDNVRVEGLEGKNYIDQLRSNVQCMQEGDVIFTGEVDRIYEDDTPCCIVHDGARSIQVAKKGSKSTVIWNPWAEKAAMMGDFDDEGYQHMVCIETANAGFDMRTLKPGESHVLTQSIVLCK
ncbi:D-hexose-6-phosphate mutarotase [Sulfurovum sp.]|uniref:D-hexose-6-phosphate mutarotase n=1 Tax=Sulfurovum sp. TaxID=1969726 RepID=UPI0025FFDC14|nr:D-hexose-6-phosphate mutarotase [Sulfurovum sp.]